MIEDWGSREYKTRVVSSTRAILEPGIIFVQSGASAKASSALQLLETRMPDQVGFDGAVCAGKVKGTGKKMRKKIRFGSENIDLGPRLVFVL